MIGFSIKLTSLCACSKKTAQQRTPASRSKLGVGTTAVRVQDYQNNHNPLVTQGLTFLSSASINIVGLASFTFTNLSAENYYLFVRGNATAGLGTDGKYTVALVA